MNNEQLQPKKLSVQEKIRKLQKLQLEWLETSNEERLMKIGEQMDVLEKEIAQELKPEKEKKDQKSNQQEPHRQKREQQKALLKEEREKRIKALQEFTSGNINWKLKDTGFYPTWEGYVNGKHLFNISRKLQQYELTLTTRGSISTNIEGLTQKAENILENFNQKADIITEKFNFYNPDKNDSSSETSTKKD